MILWPQPDGSVIATPQPAHALISGQLAHALRDRPEPFEPVALAAAMHDMPWMPWELAPEFDASTGLPRAFNALRGDEHAPMWERGVATARAAWGLWPALLILRHGSHIYRLGILDNRIAPAPESLAAMDGYMAREREQGAAWMRELGVGEAEVAPASAVVALCDAVALALCWGQAEFACGPSRLVRTGEFRATLDPWPLAPARLEVETEARRLPGRFASAEAMRDGLARAPRITLRFELSSA